MFDSFTHLYANLHVCAALFVWLDQSAPVVQRDPFEVMSCYQKLHMSDIMLHLQASLFQAQYDCKWWQLVPHTHYTSKSGRHTYVAGP